MNDSFSKNIEKLSQYFGADRILTKEDTAIVLKAITGILSAYKKDTESLNENTKKLIASVLTELEKQNDTLLEDIGNTKKGIVDEFNTQVTNKIKDIEKICKQVEKLKADLECMEVKDGEDADEEYVIEEVLKRIKLPEYQEFILSGEDIVTKINELSLNSDFQIDAKHIKNLPELKGRGVGGISKVTVQKMIDDSGASGVSLRTNGNTNGSQAILNLIAGTGMDLVDDGNGGITINGPTGGTGDVVGPASATDNAVARFDSTTGKLVQNSGVTISDANVISAVGALFSGLTASQLIATDASKNLVSLSTSTYPSLSELANLKGVTSAIQTQLDTKITASSSDTLTNKTINASSNTISNLTTSMFATNVIDTDSTLSANSDTRIASQKAIRSYVDNALTGLFWKPAVACATTANITLSGEQTIDGVLTSSSRVLVKNQSTASQNGIYVSGSGAWTRAVDADTGTELIGATVFITGGSTYGDTQWTCTNDSISLGSTSIVFAQVAGAGTYSAGTGLSLSGNQFSIDTSVVARKSDNLSVFASTTSAQLLALISDETGSGALVFATSPVLVTPNLGTPSAVNLTNGTALPLSGITGSTSTALGVGSLEVGHATDSTLSRLGAGDLGIEGVSILTTTNTKTITNKRKQPRVYTATNNATLTPEIDTYDIFHLTAMSANTTIANHSTSTPADGEIITLRFLDNGTARTLSWGTNYVAKGGIALPSTTTISKNMSCLFEWNANLSKYNLIGLTQEA